jgi:regulation of enolase protein 1 (concanavalin A-like superfamily)
LYTAGRRPFNYKGKLYYYYNLLIYYYDKQMKVKIGMEFSDQSKSMLHSVALTATALDPQLKNIDFLHGKYIFYNKY